MARNWKSRHFAALNNIIINSSRQCCEGSSERGFGEMFISRFEIAVTLIRKKYPPTARSASISGEKGVKRDDALWRELRPSVSGFGEGNPDKGDSWSFIVKQHNELKCLLDQFPEATFSSELSGGRNPKANKNNSVERFPSPLEVTKRRSATKKKARKRIKS